MGHIELGSKLPDVQENRSWPLSGITLSSVAVGPRGFTSDTQLRFDYATRRGDLTNPSQTNPSPGTVDWRALEVTLQRILPVAGVPADNVQFFVGVGVAFNKFSGDDFDSFDDMGLKVTPIGVLLRTDPWFGLRLGMELGVSLQHIQGDPKDFGLEPTNAFDGRAEWLGARYTNIFFSWNPWE